MKLKFYKRLEELGNDLPRVDINLVKQELSCLENLSLSEKYKQISTICQSKAYIHPEWLLFSGRLRLEGLKLNIPKKFSLSTASIQCILNQDYYNFVMERKNFLDSIIDDNEDLKYDVFSVETLIKSYLARVRKNGTSTIYETPQYMFLRVATFLCMNSKNALEDIKEMYKDLTKGKYSQASPTLFNSGLIRHQLSSCFVMDVADNIQSISESWKQCALISMNSGGVGIDFSSIRHSEIGQYGQSGGIVPWIKIVDQILYTVDQGGKRKGSGTAYLCDWHIDIESFLELKKPGTVEQSRAKNMFYAVWISDEFMRRVERDEDWSLICPKYAKGLEMKWGLDFEIAYKKCEEKLSKTNSVYIRKIKARELWKQIILCQIELGLPFILYKDSCNRKSNQKNLGTIRLSNLCTEILLYTDKDNIASCNLSSIALNSCVENGVFNYEELERITRRVVRNLNNVIDKNYYPSESPQIENCNLKNRPLGIGVQGLADTFALLDISWLQNEAKHVNSMIFETIYYAAVSESMELAKIHGKYDNFEGSPLSKGQFQFDLWDMESEEKFLRDLSEREESLSPGSLEQFKNIKKGPYSDRYDWETLRKDVIKYGVRNSTLTALMPTASSAHITGNNECFEPFTNNIYTRTCLSGQFTMMNKHLVSDLEKEGLWNTEIVRELWSSGGSIQEIPETSERVSFLKEKYLTSFEIPQKILLEMALDRGRYICQSQSFNCWMNDPTYAKLNAFHFAGWKGGMKTGMYYLRQSARSSPINFSLDSIQIPKKEFECNDDVCISCSS